MAAIGSMASVPRQMRVEYPGAIYHIMSRGDRQQAIYLDDADRHDFLKTLAQACQKTGFQVHAYCLMRNHFHLVVETPNANLVAGMRWLLSSYTLREIATRLHLGSWRSLKNRLYLAGKSKSQALRRKPMK